MNQALIDKIRSFGYWRVNIRPQGAPIENLTFARCRELVEKNKVSLRGWDYPHVSRNDDHGGYQNAEDHVVSWCDWYPHVEFWRMYRSSQFLHYKALREDIYGDIPNRPEGPFLSVGSTIYTLTEIFEFTFRLFRAGLYKNGAVTHITIGNTAGRELWIGDPMRMGFSYARKTAAQQIKLEHALSVSELEAEPLDISSKMAVELFDHFNWQASISQIRSDQERFYKRQV